MLEQNEKQQELANICSFVTIKIFARTEQLRCRMDVHNSFVTIKIFARTEQKQSILADEGGFVTIKIFARTERWKRNGY